MLDFPVECSYEGIVSGWVRMTTVANPPHIEHIEFE